MTAFQIELGQRDACLVRRRLSIRSLDQQGFPASGVFEKLGDARPRQQAFACIDPGDSAGYRHGLMPIATDDTRSEQIEFQKIAQRLEIPAIEGQGGVDLSAETAGQEQLLEGSGTLRRDTQHLRDLPVILRRATVQSDRLLGQGEWRRPIAERAANL